MALRQEAELVSFDADAACEWLAEELGGDLRSVAEYTPEGYTLLYLSDDVEADYGSVGTVEDVAESVHEYISLDFREREMFHDLFPPLEDVEGFVTVAGDATVARVLTDEDEGLYFSTSLDAPVVDAIATLGGRFE